MELLITIAYIFLIRLIFFDYSLLRYNLFWKFVTFGLWVGAALTEVIFLGQYAPYSKEMFVQSYVVQMAPEFGGLVKEVHVTQNEPVKKGDPLFQMDPEPWQYKVNHLQAQLAAADTDVAELNQQVVEAIAGVRRVESNLEVTRVQYGQFKSAAEKSAVSQLRLEAVEKDMLVLEAELESARAAQRAAEIALHSEVGDKHTAVAEVLAELAQAKYKLEHTTVRAPSDGYVSNLQIYPGSFVRLKQPVMSFINSEEHWLLATVPQRGIHRLRPGDKAQVAFEMYPGKIFDAEVENVVWAVGEAQGIPGGQLPRTGQLRGSELFTVRLRMKKEDPDYPLRFGASGLVAMYSTDAADFLLVLRSIELQSESFLDYLYNPFK
ncbi:MAG: HlyD family secretion protein [Gammaproteobacteria bacterium]|nr:HlyD family secretion protein [Gammaproteobacteria bacterium]